MGALRHKTRGVRDRWIMAVLGALCLLWAVAAMIQHWEGRSRLAHEAEARLDSVAAQIAHASRSGLAARSYEALGAPLEAALAGREVVHVAYYGPNGRLLRAGGRLSPPPLTPDRPAQLAREGPRRLRSGALDLVLAVLERADPSGAREGQGLKIGYVRVLSSADGLGLAQNRPVPWGMPLALGSVLGMLLGLNLSRSVVSHTQAELRDSNAELERRVDLRTRELDQARRESERASEAKSQFLANMSHELRTPLTAILGYADLLLDKDVDLPPSVEENVSIIRGNGAYLLELLNDILDLAKIEAGRLDTEEIPSDLVQILGEVVSLLRVRADEKSLRLIATFATPIPSEIVTDPTRVRQSLLNLMGNAIKFTRQGSVTVRVEYISERQEVRIGVKDTGIGVPEDKLGTLFEPFFQAESSMTRRFGGTGLGLAITKRIAQALGGDCTVESRLGVGSHFMFSFRAPPTPKAERISVSSPMEGKREPDRIQEGGAALDGLRVLLAEDAPDNQRLLSTLLQKAGAEVVVVENGRLAVERAEQDRFDLVLMDMAMPEMDGYQATRTLREVGFEAPIVALTAHAMSGERERCLEAGCNEYLTKPVDRGKLVSTVQQLTRPDPAKPPPPTSAT